MSRISQDGITYVAKEGMSLIICIRYLPCSCNLLDVTVPTGPGALNIFIQDLPQADDYYIIFLNSTSGNMFGSSSKFSIGSSANGTTTTNPAVATVTVSGAPNPTVPFATTFPAAANGVALPGWQSLQSTLPHMFAILGVVIMCLVGGAWTVL